MQVDGSALRRHCHDNNRPPVDTHRPPMNSCNLSMKSEWNAELNGNGFYHSFDLNNQSILTPGSVRYRLPLIQVSSNSS